MSMADIVIIVIVALFALVGLAKGFFKTLISFFGWFISMLVAVLTARVVAEALLDIPAVAGFVTGNGGGWSLFGWLKGILPEGLMSLPAGATEADITAALGGGAVGAVLKPFIGLLTGEAIAVSTATVGEGIALTLAGGLFMVLVGLGMFIACRIVMTLFVMFAKSLISPDGKTGALNRFMGFLLGAVRGALYCVVLLVVIGCLTPFGFMEPVTAEIDKGVIAKPAAEQVYALSSKLMSNDNYFNKLLELSGLKGNEQGGGEEDDGYQPAPAETQLKSFAAEAFVDGGGLFNTKLTSAERPEYNVWSEGLSAYMSAAADKIAKGDVKTETVLINSLLTETSAGGLDEKAGRLYQAFNNLAVDLGQYFSYTDEQADLIAAIKDKIEVDFANVEFLIDETKFNTLFGVIEFTGLEKQPDLSVLYPETEEKPTPEPTPEPNPEPTPEPDVPEAETQALNNYRLNSCGLRFTYAL